MVNRELEAKVMDAAEVVIKQAIADGFSPEEAMALMVIGATTEVCLRRIHRDMAERKAAREQTESERLGDLTKLADGLEKGHK